MFSIRLNKKLKGIRARLTFVYSTLFGLFICIFAYILAGQYIHSYREDFDAALLNYAIDLSDQVLLSESEISTPLKIPPRERKKLLPFLLGSTVFQVRSIDGHILSRGPKPGIQFELPYKADLAYKEDYTHRLLSLEGPEGTYRAVNIKFTSSSGKKYILQVATPSTILEEQRNRHILINVLTIPLLILVSSIASFLIAGNALTPIKMLIDSANNIAASNLSSRVQELDTGDEVEELSKTLNTLLERLEKSFNAKRNFVANASHQLNTPLAIIKGELDVLESKTRSMEDHIKFQKSLREELERLIELVKNLLLVSRVESGQGSFVFRPIRVDEALLGTTARLGIKSREKKITIKFNISPDLEETDLEVLGEKQLLECLFENLLENAIKYSPENSTIGLDIKTDHLGLCVTFQDEGPGIQSEALDKILTSRFQRGTEIGIPGTGIGLSIATQIAHFHQAKISYEKLHPQGSLFMIHFTK